ncbi:MAG: hypothetical protein Q9171_001585 [Xanthocarpia ochracea]
MTRLRSRKDPKFQESLHELIEDVRRAFGSGTIPSAAQVPLHLLSYYKESGHFDEGIELWNWLSGKDDAILDPIFVGPAIELLAVYGAGVQYCEDIFERTLGQQKDIGSQYQLQAGAILPDRSKAVTIRGTSTSLLQGILSARLFYGNWRSSYLTLDTAFRLRPTEVVPRILDLFVYERPIFEALPVFFMFCRGGNRVSKVTLTVLLDSLKKLADQTSNQSSKADLVRAMFQAMEAYVGSAGVLDTRHLNILTRAVVCAMPPLPATASTEPPEDDRGILEPVVDLFKQLFKYFAQHNAQPDSITFNGTIPVALSLGYPLFAKILLEDMVVLGLSPNLPTAQSLMTAAGLLRDAELLNTAWTYISESSEGRLPGSSSWRTMTIAARRCGLGSLFEEHSKLLDPEIAPGAETPMQSVDNNSVDLAGLAGTEQGTNYADDAHRFENTCAEMLHVLDRMGKFQPGGFRDVKNYPLDEGTFLAWPDIAEEGWQRKLYDELTQQEDHENRYPMSLDEINDQETPAVSNTGIAFDELRYLNWKTINSLLVQAQAFDKRVEVSTDAAIRDRRASPERRGSKTTNPTAGPRYVVSTAQLETYQQDKYNEKAREIDEDSWRALILRLREPAHEAQTFINTVAPS